MFFYICDEFYIFMLNIINYLIKSLHIYKMTCSLTFYSNEQAQVFNKECASHKKSIQSNSYLSHRIIDSFPRISKWKFIRLKPVFIYEQKLVLLLKTNI